MIRTRHLWLLLPACLLFGASQISVAQTLYDVKGKVYGPDSKPVANTLVSLENNARALIAQDVTNSDGRYQFSGITAGTYYISVKPKEAYLQSAFQMVELINTTVGGRGIATETVDFSLKANVQPHAAAGTTYVQDVPPEAEKEYLSAVKSMAKGDKQQAAKQLARAIQIFPQYFLALLQLGLLDLEKGSYEDSVDLLKKAITVNTRAAQAHLGLGMAYVNLDQSREAINELNAARSLDARLFQAHLYLGIALISIGDLDSAEKSLKEALKVGGSVQARAAHLYLTSIYNTRKDYKAAIDEMQIYLRENPNADNAANIKAAIAKLKAKL